MKKIIGVALACSLTLAGASPRVAKELKIKEPSGKQTLLSQYKGDVVIVQFLYTSCGHCAATARTFTKLQAELGGRGLRVLGVAFNEEAQQTQGEVQKFIAANKVGFPIGVATQNEVLSYLGISVMTRFAVPQVMIVDRNGVIQAQSQPLPSGELQDESYLRPLLDRLLSEPGKALATSRK